MLVSDFGRYSSGGGRSDKVADGTSDCGECNSHRDESPNCWNIYFLTTGVSTEQNSTLRTPIETKAVGGYAPVLSCWPQEIGVCVVFGCGEASAAVWAEVEI
ncbi:unnamed protein product, partial [Pylaiella littoralis]